MKKAINIIAVLVFALYVSAFTQIMENDPTLIKEGIYLSFDDFKHNTPSITNFSIIDKKRKINEHFDLFELSRFMELVFLKKHLYICYFSGRNDTIVTDISKIWGFSDGRNIFIKAYNGFYRICNIEIFCRLEYWEKKRFFYTRQYSDYDIQKYERSHIPQTQEIEPNYKNNSILDPNLLIDILILALQGKPSSSIEGHFLNYQTGKVHLRNEFTEQVLELIKSDSELYLEFENDPIRFKNKKIKAYKYFLLYKDRHPVIYPVDQ